MKPNYSATSLKRWSSKAKQIPDIQAIKSLHVYDFDNTLFCSPLPNPQIWYSGTIGFLQTYEAMAFGGWWHDPSILAATGEGIDKEETKAWAGHWNETVVELVRCSMQDPDALTVLLTGRSDTQFADLINRICNAKQLDFDLVVLKPEVGPTGEQYSSTIAFKQAFLHDLVYTYKTADDLKMYEDRPKHVKAFRDYFDKLNKSFLSHPVDQPAPPRKPINCEVIHVCELKSSLDPKTEIEVLQKAIDRHNQTIASGGPNPHKSSNKRLRIEENYLYFGYLINETDSARLISLTNVLPHLIDSGEVKYLASSILIAPYKPGRDLVQKVGGRGKKVMWQVNGISKLEDRIWAARVVPVDPNDRVHTQDQTPVVVLAIRKGSRPIEASRIQNWQPVSSDKAFMFQTTVGDKVMLKVEEVGDGRAGDRSRRRVDGDGGYRRKFAEDGDLRYHKENWPRPGGERDDANPGNSGGLGGAIPGNRNRNRPPGYRSLDDYGSGSFDGAADSKVVMDY
ncbi:hypothetical protein DV738_g1850, partial [Chaetothyriales sp. CBS 135597]